MTIADAPYWADNFLYVGILMRVLRRSSGILVDVAGGSDTSATLCNCGAVSCPCRVAGAGSTFGSGVGIVAGAIICVVGLRSAIDGTVSNIS